MKELNPKGLKGYLKDDPSLEEKKTYDEFVNGEKTSNNHDPSLEEAYKAYREACNNFILRKDTKVLNIKRIRDASNKADKIIMEREMGNLSAEFLNNEHSYCQPFGLYGSLKNKSILSMSSQEYALLGEYISKAKELVALMGLKDMNFELFRMIVNKNRKFIQTRKTQLSSEFLRSKDGENIRIRVYADMLGLRLETAHDIINNFTNKRDLSYSWGRMLTKNLTDAIFAGLTPEEIQIIFRLSSKEKKMLENVLYCSQKEALMHGGKKLLDFRKSFIEASEQITNILNKRTGGDFSVNVNTSNKYACYLSSYANFVTADTYSMPPEEYAKNISDLAEMSVKILFYEKLNKDVSIDSVKTSMSLMIEDDPALKDAKQAVADELRIPLQELCDKTKDAIDSGDDMFFMDIKYRTLSSICQVDDDTSRFIQKYFICSETYETTYTFRNIAGILMLMRTDLDTECIRHSFCMDNDITKAFKKLFKARI